MTPHRFPAPWRLLLLLLALALAACGESLDRQREPPRLAGRVFDASADGLEAFAYLSREVRYRPGPPRLSRQYERYALTVRRLADGAVVHEVPLVDIMDAMKQVTPSVLGVADGVLWLQRDAVEGYRLPTLEPVSLPASSAGDDAATASLRAQVLAFAELPFWQKPGMARLFTQVSSALARPPEASSALAALALPDAGVLMRDERSPWLLDAPASALVMTVEPDGTWSLLRVTLDGELRWRAPLGLRFAAGFVLFDAATHVVFTDAEAHADRAGARDRVVWVNVQSGQTREFEVATGTVTVKDPG